MINSAPAVASTRVTVAPPPTASRLRTSHPVCGPPTPPRHGAPAPVTRSAMTPPGSPARWRGALAVCLLAGLTWPALAEGGEADAEARALQAKEKSITDALDAVDQRINEVVRAQELLRLHRQERSQDVAELDGRLAALDARTEDHQAAWWRLFLSTDHPTPLVRRRGTLAAVLRADLTLIKSSQADAGRLRGLQAERAVALSALTASEARLRTQRQRLERERGLKATVLRELRAERRLHARVAAQRAAQRATLSIPAAAEVPGGDFAAERGHLPMPAKGVVVRGFGRHEDPELGTETLSTGVVIDAPLGAPVRAVYDGRVVYSGWYKGYGNLVIIDHGGGHHTLYGHLLAISRARGESVTQGTVIGEVGDTGSLRGPQLFFELRAGRRPVDPRRWLRSRP